MTNAALDPFAKVLKFKYCAVRVAPASPSRPLVTQPRGLDPGQRTKAALDLNILHVLRHVASRRFGGPPGRIM